MEEGSLRCDANISLRPVGETKFGNKAELKNMNSFRNVQRGLEYEVERQRELYENGEAVVQETRRFDEATQTTISMRSKEEAHDYRYFPEPDLVDLDIDDAWLAEIRASIPELPAAKRQRYEAELGLPAYDAGVLTADPQTATYYEQVIGFGVDAKAASNWVMSDILGALNNEGKTFAECPITPENLAGLISEISSGKISSKQGRDVFKSMWETGKSAAAIIQEQGMEQISDASVLGPILDEIIANNPKSVADYKGGKDRAIAALVGQAMKATKGKANPGLVNQLLIEKINAID